MWLLTNLRMCAMIMNGLLRKSSGPIAQLGERRVRNAEVRGSNPLGSTKQVLDEHLFLAADLP